MLELFENEKEVGSPSGSNFVTTTLSGNFTTKLKTWVDKALRDYKSNIDLNKSIALIAQSNNLSDDQIQRIIEEVNTQVYLDEYAKTKNQGDRDVEFNIASLPKVKNLTGTDMGKPSKQTTTAPGDGGEKPNMAKKASLADSLNFTNYSPYKTAGLSAEKKISHSDILSKDISEKIASSEAEYSVASKELLTDVNALANALIKYAQLNEDYQEIFSNVCKEASFMKSNQILIKEAVTQLSFQMKENRSLPKNFDMSLNLVDANFKEAKLSLGEHSLIKEASDGSSNKPLPTIVTNKGAIKDYKQLIALVNKIKKGQENITSKQAMHDKAQKILQRK